MKPWGIALFVLAILCIVITIIRIIITFVKDSKSKKKVKKQEIMNCDSIIIDGVLYNYQYCPNNIHIENSCNIKKRYFDQTLTQIWEKHPELNVWKRSIKSLKKEWATHNFLYSFGLWKNRTKDVDLNYPNKWSWLYNIFGSIIIIFVK